MNHAQGLGIPGRTKAEVVEPYLERARRFISTGIEREGEPGWLVRFGSKVDRDFNLGDLTITQEIGPGERLVAVYNPQLDLIRTFFHEPDTVGSIPWELFESP